MPKYFTLLALIFCLNSCEIHINGSLQGLYSYYEKTYALNPGLFVKDTMCAVSLSDSIKIIIRSGGALKNCVKDYDKTIVYLWSPKCKSKFCPSLDILQHNCKEKGITLFVVAEYYDNTLMKKQYRIEKPISGIDTKYYHTNLTSKYTARFFSDLTGKTLDKDYQRLWYFENGVFVKMVQEINSL